MEIDDIDWQSQTAYGPAGVVGSQLKTRVS
mgnify:CR=1 FL=1